MSTNRTMPRILETKLFWLSLLTLYLVLFLLTHVQVHQDAYFGDAFGVMEPVWHLILRNLQIIDGAEYSQYGVSWKPILFQLPYTVLFYAASTLIIVIVIIGTDKTIKALRAKQEGKAT